MVDRKPPRLARDERATLLALLQYQRESLARKLEGIDDDDARRSPVPSGTSLLWLVQHLATAESLWVRVRFAGEDVDPAAGESLDASVAEALARYRQTWAEVDAAIAASTSLDATCRNDAADPPVSLRWVIAHLLEETARHAGHADILRELVDGDTGR